MTDGVGLSERVQDVLDQRVRPYLQSHGGDVAAFELHGDTIEVHLIGACRVCELVPVTFASRIRAELLNVEGVTEVKSKRVPYSPARLDRIAGFFADSD